MRRGLDRIRAVVAVRSLAELVDPTPCGCEQAGVVLPPHVETSSIVEEWEGCDFLARRFGAGARIGNVLTLLDAEVATEQLASADPISARGWGRSARDARTVADIAVGQIESASHLALVGASPHRDGLVRVLDALNPKAARLSLDEASDAELRAFVTCDRGTTGDDRCGGSARIVPPWLELLQAEPAPAGASDRFLYRRSRPFDPERFGQWFSEPPREIVRAKGKIWLANSRDVSVGYSCAGSVHRVFPAGRWWASCAASAWPTEDDDRRRLLELWHPDFGDRRQELAFVGVDLDPDAISAALDACLLSEEEAREAALPTAPKEPLRAGAAPRGALN